MKFILGEKELSFLCLIFISCSVTTLFSLKSFLQGEDTPYLELQDIFENWKCLGLEFLI